MYDEVNYSSRLNLSYLMIEKLNKFPRDIALPADIKPHELFVSKVKRAKKMMKKRNYLSQSSDYDDFE